MKTPSHRPAARVVLAAFALCCVQHAAIAAVYRAEPEVQPPALSARAKAKALHPATIANVRLPAPAADLAKDLVASLGPGAPLQVGIGRTVMELRSGADLARRLAWETIAGGHRVAAISVTSEGAAALRLGLRINALPIDTVLRFYAPGEAGIFSVTNDEMRASLARNLEDDGQVFDTRTYWSPVVEGDTIVLEIDIPAAASPAEVEIASPAVSHLVASPATNFAMPKAASSCNLDVMCYQDTWGPESNSEARIIFTRDGASYVCSGTLIADQDPSSLIPFFLTANHCISAQTDASTIQSYWFYRSSACDSGVRGPSKTLAGGATLLYASDRTDTSFLRLNNPPPAGAVYAGWIVGATPPLGAQATGIHHPTGDLQKISFGNFSAYYTCASSGDGTFSCNRSTASTSTFFGVQWRSGITESGSSGSGLFLDDGQYLVGQLYGGSGNCTTSGTDYYGRLDVAYNAALSRWLGTTSTGTNTLGPQENYSDLWWNPAESGWGLSITQHGTMIFAAWYIYDDAGRPSWVVMPGGRWTSPTQFAGDLYTVTGPDPTGPFDASQVVRTQAGSATLTFAARDSGTLSYQVNGIAGSKAIQRQAFGVPDSTATQSFQDLWWNADESGWGLSISQQYRTLFAVWYSYDADRRGTWYVMPGGTWNGNTYSGALYRTVSAQGAFLGRGFDPGAVGRTPVGSMAITFNDASSATMSYTVDGISGSKAITRQPF